MYQLDFKKLVTWLIPVQMRKDPLLPWAVIWSATFGDIYTRLMKFRDSIIYRITITPQVCYLEKMLNDRFDKQSRRIYITDAIRKQGTFLYTKAENKPVILYTKAENKPVILYTSGELPGSSDENDFIVNIPISLSFSESELRGLLDLYKLANKKYSFNLF